MNYRIRYSNKAKNLQLQISLRGLEVVVPNKQSFSSTLIQEFLHKKKHWIDKHIAKQVKYEKETLLSELPHKINLAAINQIWEVIYIATTEPNQLLWIENASQQLTLIGDIKNRTICLDALREWLLEQAKKYLIKKLESLSSACNLPFQGVTIRHSRTRWGSCSHRKKINLSAQIMFLPPQLVTSVLLHELCHTKLMHHRESFWELLEQYDPCVKNHAKALKIASHDVPFWVSSKK